MPIFNFVQWDSVNLGTFERDGPLIRVEISMPAALEEWCTKNNVLVAPPVPGYALIDTGASISGIHEPILEKLSIVPIDSIILGTAGGDGKAFVYPTRVGFPDLNIQGYPMSRVVGNQVNWSTPDGKNVIMLLGRDLLKYFLFTYNGNFNMGTLAY
jgi:hypothetical protein